MENMENQRTNIQITIEHNKLDKIQKRKLDELIGDIWKNSKAWNFIASIIETEKI